MRAAALAAAVAALTVAELDDFVRELPHAPCVSLCALCDDRVRAERYERAPGAPAVLAPPPQASEWPTILTAPEAAAFLRISVDTLYGRVARGELLPLPRPLGGRLKFARAGLAAFANGTDLRYIPPDDAARRKSPPPPPRVDATPGRRRAERDSDDRRPLGTRGARRDAPRRDEPWAPGQAAWADPPGPPRPKG